MSPILRRRCFSTHNLCISLEIPEKETHESQKLVKRLLDSTKECKSRDEFIDFILNQYPEQGKLAIENYKRYYNIKQLPKHHRVKLKAATIRTRNIT